MSALPASDAPARWRRRFAALAKPRAPEALPVQFDRHRIYVLPTRFGMFLAVLLLAMAVGALNYNNNPALLLCLMLGGAAMASLLAAHLQLSGLAVTALDAEPVAAGQPLKLHVHAKADPGRERRGLQLVSDEDNARAVLSLDNGSGHAVLDLPTQRRGWRDLERLRIATTRPLGLARAWAYVWPQTPLLVYPAPEPHGPPLPSGVGDSRQVRTRPLGADVHHLRDYRHGDARRAIAWKPSARHGSLLVREFEQPLGAEVVLDWHALSGLPYEQRIRRLARWVDEAERHGRRYQLRLPAHPPLGPGAGLAHRHACLRALALLPEG